jgi:hypothetical protein
VQIRESGYDLNAETVKRDTIIIEAAGFSIPQKVENANNKFTMNGYEPDFAELYLGAGELIKKDLEEKYISTIRIKARDAENHVPVSNGTIILTTKKAVKLQELINAEKSIRGKYFVEGSELFRKTQVDPSYLLIDLDKQQFQIPAEGVEIKSTRGFDYNAEYTHLEYKFERGKISFDEKSGNWTIDMLSLGSKIRKGDLGNTSSGIKKDK